MTQFGRTALLVALAATAASLTAAQAANTTGCTPQEKSALTLNQKLDETQGTVCPPDVTPAAPASPSGSSGGGQSIPPK